MSINALVGARALALNAALNTHIEARYREGRIWERVRLFERALHDVVRPWRRAAAQRVLDEAREHEETCRAARLDAGRVADMEIAALCADYTTLLDAIERIARGGPDPMEIASQALDKAMAAMQRYAPSVEAGPITLHMNAEPFKLQIDYELDYARKMLDAMMKAEHEAARERGESVLDVQAIDEHAF